MGEKEIYVLHVISQGKQAMNGTRTNSRPVRVWHCVSEMPNTRDLAVGIGYCCSDISHLNTNHHLLVAVNFSPRTKNHSL